jgi:hypothetical protein
MKRFVDKVINADGDFCPKACWLCGDNGGGLLPKKKIGGSEMHYFCLKCLEREDIKKEWI